MHVDHARENDEARAFLAAYEPEPTPSETLRIEPTLAADARGGLRVALRVGVSRLYVARNLVDFLDCVRSGRKMRFAKGFTYDPADHAVSDDDTALLRLLFEEGCDAPDARWVLIARHVSARLLGLLEGREFRWLHSDGTLGITCIEGMPPPLHARLMCGSGASGLDDGGVRLQVHASGRYRPLTPDYAYFTADGRVGRVPEEALAPLMPLLTRLDDAGRATLSFSAPLASRLAGDVLPDIEPLLTLTIDEALQGRIARGDLRARFELTALGGDIVVRVSYAYGAWSIDPFGESTVPPAALLMRDRRREAAVQSLLEAYSFHVRKGGAYLSEPEAMLRFLSDGVEALQGLGEVFVSEDFLHMKPRKARISARIRTSRGGRVRLDLDLDGLGSDEEARAALAAAMNALRSGSSWMRLPDGAFLELPDEWLALAAELPPPDDGGWSLSRAQALSAASLWDRAALPLTLTRRAAELFTGLQAPETPITPLDELLRPYQRQGVAWLWARVRMGLGGILADDMGLGKTVQVIAILAHAKAALSGNAADGDATCTADGIANGLVDTANTLPALVLAPTTLLFNWRDELARFAPQLQSEILEGGPEARRAQMERRGVDVFIASYAQLRRDETLFEGMRFGMLVLDEAQHVKNAATNGARAVRGIVAESRFALTGTPIENHVGELWAITDAVLPGYLGEASAFFARYDEPGGEAWLRRRIAPFLLRRMKIDVLPELPERIDHRINVAMTPDQTAVYARILAELREHIGAGIRRDGAARHGMRILAALTRLRQTADHPALAQPGYAGESGKMEALIEVLTNALDGGHRVLVFSQFTGMLGLVRERLDGMGVSYLYLDGSTPTNQREQLVRWYQQGVSDLFLISLKAGGFGLNLTRADTVILTDPWWNPATEQQAGDRAHRIGQQNPVHVIRLIAKGTVEEAVARMQDEKRALVDTVLADGEFAPRNPADWAQLLMDTPE